MNQVEFDAEFAFCQNANFPLHSDATSVTYFLKTLYVGVTIMNESKTEEEEVFGHI